MGKATVPQAKNLMRRALSEILDPGPTSGEVIRIWKFFDSKCASCGSSLTKGSREGHLDHLDSTGPNATGNRVLSCGTCNSDEKRDMPWERFLRLKCPDEGVRIARRSRILDWVAQNPLPDEREQGPELQAAVAHAESLVEAFGAACTQVRNLAKVRVVEIELPDP